jgi:hypothetical protein
VVAAGRAIYDRPGNAIRQLWDGTRINMTERLGNVLRWFAYCAPALWTVLIVGANDAVVREPLTCVAMIVFVAVPLLAAGRAVRYVLAGK